MNTTSFNSTTQPSHKAMEVWVWVVRGIIAVLTVIGNFLVMALILKSRRLRVIPNTFIFSLALADFLVGLVITPSDFACNYWFRITCDWRTLTTTYDILIHLSVTNLCALTFDRYIAVVQPLRYNSVINRGHAALILVFSLITAAILPLIGHVCITKNYTLTAKILRVVDMAFLQVVPTLLLGVAYLRMVNIAREHEKTVKMQHSQLSFNYGKTVVDKTQRKKQESRERASVKMIGAVIIAFVICYTLAIIRSLVFYILDMDMPATVTQISRILLLSNSAVNFLVYAFLKKDFRYELKRISARTRSNSESFTFHDLLSKESSWIQKSTPNNML